MHNFMLRTLIIIGALYLRHTPFRKGRYRITVLLLPLLRRLGPDMNTRIIQTRYGFRFHIDPADWLGQYVYLTGAYEPPTSDVFRELVKPGHTIIDIGANSGYFSLLSATLVGSRGQVIAFEPIPSVRQALLANIQLNKLENVQVIPSAVSDRADKITIYEGPAGHKGISSIRPIASASRKVLIDTIPLDSLVHEFSRLDCVKVDVEGAEFLVLLGMDNLIRTHHPCLIIEFTNEYLKSFGHSVGQMSEWLISRGYRIYRIEDQGLIRFDSNEKNMPEQFNVLAAHSLPPRLATRVIH